jgi:hypothetical protein
LETIGLPELYGIDHEILDLITRVPVELAWEEGVRVLRTKIQQLIKEQIAKGGSTMFFNIDHMLKTEAAILVSDIIERRKAEVEETVLQKAEDKINTMPLHMTYYGHRILEGHGIYSTLSTRRVPTLRKDLESLNLTLNIGDEERFAVETSDDLRRHIFEGELVRYVRSYIIQQYDEEKEPVSISDIMTEFCDLGFNKSEINLQLVSDISKGHIEEISMGYYLPVQLTEG